MSVLSLRTQIREDHLTCSICFEKFKKPKALPCLHTFCEDCLREYVVGRGYECDGVFPCPFCRSDTQIPDGGIQSFPDNHLTASLSDTVDRATNRPTPKPRKSLGQPQSQMPAEPQSSHASVYGSKSEKSCLMDDQPSVVPGASELQIQSPGLSPPEYYEASAPSCPSAQAQPLPPPYSSVADTRPGTTDDSDESSWAVVAKQEEEKNQPPVEYCVVSVSQPPQSSSLNTPTPSTAMGSQQQPQPDQTPPPVGWNLSALDAAHSNVGYPGVSSVTSPLQQEHPQTDGRTFNTHSPRREPPPRPAHPPIRSAVNSNAPTPAPLYPTVPSNFEKNDTVCSENLILKFGKQGSTVRDFLKPVGLAVTKEGHYVISDSGREQNRIFIFNSGGELTTAFHVGCKVKDVTITKNDEVFAAVQKNQTAIRQFTLAGQCKAEHGKFLSYDVPCGIAVLGNGGAVVTGTQCNSVYVLTDQMKLSLKFGRKGNGDGYFSHPSHVAVNSRNHVIVTDKVNNNIQVFNTAGNFKARFNLTRKGKGKLSSPLGVCVDNKDNILVADSGNNAVEIFSRHGTWLSTVVRDTQMLGEGVKPVNVAWTPTGKVAVLLRGPYFAEVRIYSSRHQSIPQSDGNRHSSKRKIIPGCWTP